MWLGHLIFILEHSLISNDSELCFLFMYICLHLFRRYLKGWKRKYAKVCKVELLVVTKRRGVDHEFRNRKN